MSKATALRLAELARKSRERRRRILELQEQSFALLEKARHFQEMSMLRKSEISHRAARDSQVLPPGPMLSSDTATAVPRSGDILAQVSRVLQDIDTSAQDYWNDNDTCILWCLREAWAAAVRNGYSLEELQAVLRLLAPEQ